MYKIRIIDSNDERGKVICGLVAQFNCLSNPWLKSIRNSEGELLNESELRPDIFLLHINDQIKSLKANCAFLEYLIQELPTSVVVIYSGASLTLDRKQYSLAIQNSAKKVWELNGLDVSRICVIQRPVNVGHELNIVAALADYSANRNIASFFQILQFISDIEYLESLSWLCQGYLAVTDFKDMEQEQDELQAIVSSWSPSDLTDKKAKVASPEWWRAPFEMSELQAKVREEWKSEEDWSQIEQLLAAIEGTQEIPLETVKQASEAISHHLGIELR